MKAATELATALAQLFELTARLASLEGKLDNLITFVSDPANEQQMVYDVSALIKKEGLARDFAYTVMHGYGTRSGGGGKWLITASRLKQALDELLPAEAA